MKRKPFETFGEVVKLLCALLFLIALFSLFTSVLRQHYVPGAYLDSLRWSALLVASIVGLVIIGGAALAGAIATALWLHDAQTLRPRLNLLWQIPGGVVVLCAIALLIHWGVSNLTVSRLEPAYPHLRAALLTSVVPFAVGWAGGLLTRLVRALLTGAGTAVSDRHVWVASKSHEVVRNATLSDVYEYAHEGRRGSGSYESFLDAFGVAFWCVGAIGAIILLSVFGQRLGVRIGGLSVMWVGSCVLGLINYAAVFACIHRSTSFVLPAAVLGTWSMLGLHLLEPMAEQLPLYGVLTPVLTLGAFVWLCMKAL